MQRRGSKNGRKEKRKEGRFARSLFGVFVKKRTTKKAVHSQSAVHFARSGPFLMRCVNIDLLDYKLDPLFVLSFIYLYLLLLFSTFLSSPSAVYHHTVLPFALLAGRSRLSLCHTYLQPSAVASRLCFPRPPIPVVSLFGLIIFRRSLFRRRVWVSVKYGPARPSRTGNSSRRSRCFLAAQPSHVQWDNALALLIK